MAKDTAVVEKPITNGTTAGNDTISATINHPLTTDLIDTVDPDDDDPAFLYHWIMPT